MTPRSNDKRQKELCKKCNGLGWREIRDKQYPEYTYNVPCECRVRDERAALFFNARIPSVYKNCSFSNFKPKNESQTVAKRIAQEFTLAYLPAYANACLREGFRRQASAGTPDEAPTKSGRSRGLLFMGSCGVGKTHLAVSILKELATTKGVPCLFRDFSKLLSDIRATYNPQSQTSEGELLEPLYNAEILLLDDVGAVRTTDWVQDILYSIINTRYSERRTTLFTTNYPDKYPDGDSKETLEERIGARIRSRLFEMCLRVEMEGADYRRSGSAKKDIVL